MTSDMKIILLYIWLTQCFVFVGPNHIVFIFFDSMLVDCFHETWAQEVRRNTNYIPLGMLWIKDDNKDDDDDGCWHSQPENIKKMTINY